MWIRLRRPRFLNRTAFDRTSCRSRRRSCSTMSGCCGLFSAMMGLLSTIRGKSREKSVICEDTPLTPKEKKLIIGEFNKLLEVNSDLFKTVWSRSAKNSISIKKAFGMTENEIPEENENFMKIWPTIQSFFYKLVITMELDDVNCQNACHQLGRRHVDFMNRGFHSTFWDVFQVCMTEVVDESLRKYTNDAHRKEVNGAWQRFVSYITTFMRSGYNERRKAELVKQT